jgi:hypothetical protein
MAACRYGAVARSIRGGRGSRDEGAGERDVHDRGVRLPSTCHGVGRTTCSIRDHGKYAVASSLAGGNLLVRAALRALLKTASGWPLLMGSSPTPSA